MAGEAAKASTLGSSFSSMKPGASTNMTPRYGRCEIGKRLIGYAPLGHWKTTTFLARPASRRPDRALRLRWSNQRRKFAAYIEQELVGTLSPGDIVIMDNLSAHKRAAVKKSRDRSRRSRASVSPSLQPRSRPDRTGLRQVQKHLAQTRQADARRPLERLRHRNRGDKSRRLPQLLHPRRIPI